MKPSSLIIAAIVDPFFTIEKKSPHQLLELVGRTVPKIKDGTDWKDLDAITVYKHKH